MKRIIVCLATLFVAVSAHAQFDGAVGTEGCQAISREDSRIQSWAFGVEVQRGYEQNSTTDFVSYGHPYMAQGLPDGTTTTAVALGEGGVDTDSQGNIIYDAQSGGWATGFDFTGLGVINQKEAYQVADFEGLLTNADANGIIGEWKYMDLTSLGECHKVIFTLSSNDDSGYGINVPAYFCIDAFSYYSSAESSSLKEELANEFSVNVFPNPASSKTNICVNGLDNKATITVSDMQGNIILSNQINNETYELNVENYASGVYFIKITSENIVKTQKLIVK